MPIATSIIRNTASNLVGQIVQVGTVIVLTPFIIHALGISMYGVWVMLTAITNYYGLLDMGLSSTYVKYIAEYRAKEDHDALRQIITTGFYTSLAIALVLLALGSVFRTEILSLFAKGYSHLQYVRASYSAALLLFSLVYLGQFFQSILDGYQRMELKNMSVVIQRLLNFLLVLIFLYYGMGLYGLVLSGLVSWAVFLIVNLCLARRLFKGLSFSIRHVSIQKFLLMVSFSWKVQITMVSGWLVDNLDKLFLGYFTNMATVAMYDVAVKIRNLSRMPVISYISTLIPAASELSVRSKPESIKEFYLQCNKWLMVILLPVCGFIFANSNLLIYSWVGSGFETAALVLQILMLGNIMNLATGCGTSIARGINKPGMESEYLVIVVALMSALGYYCAKHYGLIGLSIGSTIALAIPSLWFISALNKYLGVPNLRVFQETMKTPLVSMLGLTFLDYLANGFFTLSLHERPSLLLLVLVKFVAYGGFYYLILDMTNYIKIRQIIATGFRLVILRGI
jgi:O-antigen/teichoic acid export membrane protein